MQMAPGRTLALAGLASLLMLGCSNPMASDSAAGGASTTTASATKNVSTPAAADGGGMTATGPLRCAPSTGMLDACSNKALGDGCSLSGKRDGGWSLSGSCRSTLDGTGLACVPTPPGPPPFLVNACSGQSSGVACKVTGPSGHTFEGSCVAARNTGTLFCGKPHTPPAAAVDACTGKSAGDGCERPEHHDGGSKPGICRTGPGGNGPLACRPASSPGALACAGLDAGATCTVDFGHKKHGGEGLSGSCVVPAGGGASTCLVACTDLIRHRFHHRHGEWGKGGNGPHGPPWWKHGGQDAGTAAP
jgi:hypothetical protein